MLLLLLFVVVGCSLHVLSISRNITTNTMRSQNTMRIKMFCLSLGFFFIFPRCCCYIVAFICQSEAHSSVRNVGPCKLFLLPAPNEAMKTKQNKKWIQQFDFRMQSQQRGKKWKNTKKKSNEEFAKRTHKYIYVMCKFPLRPQIVYLLHEWFVCVFFLILLLLALPSLLNSPQMHVSTAAVGSDNRRTHTAHSSLSLGMWKVKATAIFIFKSSGAMWWWPNAIGRPHRYFKW